MENEIRDFFHAAAPRPGDDTTFRLELNARLAAAEQIKQFHDQQIRSLRRRTRLLFAAGLLLGGAVVALFLLHPVQFPDFPSVLSGIPGLPEIFPGLPRYLPWILIAIPIVFLTIFLPLARTRQRNSF